MKRIFLIINAKALFVTVLAIASTYVCSLLHLEANFPLTIIATAVVFPIVFSISGAYKRRETALSEYGSMKAHGMCFYFASRDWLTPVDAERNKRCKLLLKEVFNSTRKLLTANIKRIDEHEPHVYLAFSKMSHFVETELRSNNLAAGEISRCSQYISKMLVSFENLKHIYQYRTPQTLRAYSSFFITVLPVLYGPYFAYIAKDYSSGLGYMMPVLFTIIFVSLDNIQSQLENPFDQFGEDDVQINAEKFIERLTD